MNRTAAFIIHIDEMILGHIFRIYTGKQEYI